MTLPSDEIQRLLEEHTKKVIANDWPLHVDVMAYQLPLKEFTAILAYIRSLVSDHAKMKESLETARYYLDFAPTPRVAVEKAYPIIENVLSSLQVQ